MPWCTCTSAVNSLHNCTCSARAVHVHFFLKKYFFYKNDFFLLILNIKSSCSLKRLWYSGNNMFAFHECELAIQKYKNIKTDTLCVTVDYTKNYSESCWDSDSDSESETLWGGPSSSSDTGSSTVISMSHGSRPASYISRRCSNFKLV